MYSSNSFIMPPEIPIIVVIFFCICFGEIGLDFFSYVSGIEKEEDLLLRGLEKRDLDKEIMEALKKVKK
jgi:hypothetical protein